MKLEIKNRWDGKIIYQDEADSFDALVQGAVKSGANLCGANLCGYHSFGPGGSRSSYTWARWEPEGYMVHCGCQTLTLKDFAAAVKKKHGSTYHGKWYAANIAVMELVAAESKAAYDAKSAALAALEAK